jgi:hypothetical protein
VEPLDWNGKDDSLFQEFSTEEGKFMEYHMTTVFEDVPVQLMNEEMRAYYPHLFDGSHDDSRRFSFYHLWSK